MVIEVLDVMNYVHTIVQNAQVIIKHVLSVMMAITQALLRTAHHNAYPDVKRARQEPRVHHAKMDIKTLWVKMIVVFVPVPKIVNVIMVNVHHVRTDITIPVIYVIIYVQVTVSRVCRVRIVDRVRMVIIKVTRMTTLISLCLTTVHTNVEITVNDVRPIIVARFVKLVFMD
jgi:hypothetical protein